MALGVKRVSALVRGNGEEVMSWVITEQDQERQLEAMRAVVEGMNSEITPAAPVKAPPVPIQALDLLNLYTVSDFHLGMLAWGEETGEDWDMAIAEDQFYRWFVEAFARAPDAGTAVINILGDMAHFDSLDAVTPASGHILDADTRYQKIVESRNMIVEQHRTLAAKDAYASRGGWMSGRSANVITYSANYGEVARLTISPEMLK